MTAIDRRATITPEHQAKLDDLADALTETVKQRLLGDMQFFDLIAAVLRRQERESALEIRQELIHLLRAFERSHGFPVSVPARDPSVDKKFRA